MCSLPPSLTKKNSRYPKNSNDLPKTVNQLSASNFTLQFPKGQNQLILTYKTSKNKGGCPNNNHQRSFDPATRIKSNVRRS